MYLYMYNNKIPKNVSFKCSAMGYGASMGGRDQATGPVKDQHPEHVKR